MNRLIICFLSFFISISVATAQTPPKRELRATWFSTFLNLDWPSTATRSVQQVKDSVIKMLDLQLQTGINAIYFQVRNECDAVYPSAIEPWSASVTGTQGMAPANNFDPLQFMIDECRKRGIEIHAWFNPYRAVNNYYSIGSYASNHVAKTHPEWLLSQGSLRILKDASLQDDKQLLIVDDLVDTGETAKALREHFPKACFVTVYAKPQGKPLVDHYITDIEQDTWIQLPWDMELAYSKPLADK